MFQVFRCGMARPKNAWKKIGKLIQEQFSSIGNCPVHWLDANNN